MTLALLLGVLWLAYSNGANDNFKGVATLYGCGAADFARARAVATLCTLAGGLVSIALAAALAGRFSGGGLVSPELSQSLALLLSIGAAAAATVLLATLLGMPTSTTHALTGALLGVAIIANGGAIQLTPLWTGFLLPLLISPVLAITLAAGAYLLLRRLRLTLGVTRESCVCVGPERVPIPVAAESGLASSDVPAAYPVGIGISIGETSECFERYRGRVAGLSAHTAVNAAHYASAGAVCFARAVNDTPKIAALLMVTGAPTGWELAIVALAMAVGGWLQSHRVAETMSHRITHLNPGQGLTGNVVTALLVIGASIFGVPVSTTHVSVGSIFGIGAVGGRLHWRTMTHIALTWITTLPLAALLGADLFALIGGA